MREIRIKFVVIQYVIDSISPDGLTYIFLSESIENLPEGWFARLTITITTDNGFDELFEVVKPSGEFKTFVKSRWVRKE